MAMSEVEARISWSVIEDELARRECPPETRIERNGKLGVFPPSLLLSSAETNRGVKRWACIWCTPTRGICHATDKPFAVSNPVERFERIPGPLVTDMKSGFLRTRAPSSLPARRRIVFPASSFSSGEGRLRKALSISFARFSRCESSATIGWIPLYSLVSAVMFSRKWSFAAGLRAGSSCFSTTETEVSSL